MVQNLLARATRSPGFAQSWSEEKYEFLPHREQTLSAVQRKPANAAVCKEVTDVCCGIQTRLSVVLSDPCTVQSVHTVQQSVRMKADSP
jgi:hypothetical protein